MCYTYDSPYTYNTNCKLSQLLTKTTNGVTTKYLYGRGLIGEQTGSTFTTYHFDCRGSTVAITDANGNITDSFAYDTYGNLASRTGTSKVIFLYNGRDGVITDDNGLYYMRARYYSPEMRRFVNADIVAGSIANSITLNRFAYANGNPVSLVDPFGLAAWMINNYCMSDDGGGSGDGDYNYTTAFYVTDMGLDYVGHSELYFYDKDADKWYSTEFNTSGGQTFFNKKEQAKVREVPSEAEFIKGIDNPGKLKSGDIGSVTVDGAEHLYVVLTGNFNGSVNLAEKYREQEKMGYYNLGFNNCSDYTDKLLDVANVDGAITQSLLGKKEVVSIPFSMQMQLRDATKADNILGTNNLVFNIVGDAAGGVNSLVDLPNTIIKTAGRVGTGLLWGAIKHAHEGVKEVISWFE